MYLIESKLKEAFQSGKAGKVIGLFVKVLSKRIHKQLMCSPYSYDYQTSEGKFKSFYCLFPDGKRAIRVNFQLRNSDVIHSVDFFKGPSRLPELKVYTDGLNVIQILKTVEDAIAGHVEKYSESIQEAVRPADLELQAWVNEPAQAALVQRGKISDIQRAYSQWIASRGAEEAVNSYGKLRAAIKAMASSNPSLVPQNVSLGRVETTAPIDRPLVDSGAASQFSEIQNEVDDHLKKYEMMEHYLKLIAASNQPTPINGLFIAGKAGVGKTASVKPILTALGATFKSYTGNVAGFTALYSLLWKHSSSDPVDIVIFDDCDAMLGDKKAVNLLKGAMDSYEVRTADYARTSESFGKGSSLKEVGPRTGPVTLADFSSNAGADIQGGTPERAPDSFEVKPRIIFISNLKEVPGAIGSRCLRITFNFTEDQIWDLMAANVENIVDPSRRANQWAGIQGLEFRQITVESAKEVIDFCRALKAGVDAADFRQVNFALAIWAACTDDSWKKWTRLHFRRL